MGAPGKRRTGGQSHTKKGCKSLKRKGFLARHIDQVWEDVRQQVSVHDGKHGPVGTTTKVELDDDLPALGKHYCTACRCIRGDDTSVSFIFIVIGRDVVATEHCGDQCTASRLCRYFVSSEAMERHSNSKPHKRRIKELMGPKPHTALDAELAAGKGRPDNGQPLGRAVVGMAE